MIFKPELAELVMSGQKTVTRRLANDKKRSPWYVHGDCLNVGQDYAVCPGRRAFQIGRVKVLHVKLQMFAPEGISEAEARREGFASADEFRETWKLLHGNLYRELVWRVQFEVLK